MIPAPRTSSDSTGSTAARLVLIERISTWFIDTLIDVGVRHAAAPSSAWCSP